MRYLLILTLLMLPACKEEVAEVPDPAPMTAEALSETQALKRVNKWKKRLKPFGR